MSRYSETLDTLNDTLRWINSSKGRAVLHSRSDSLSSDKVNTLSDEAAYNIVVEALANAEPIYWETQLCDIVSGAAPTLPLDWRLTDPMLFTQNGYLWFGKPLPSSVSHGLGGCSIGEEIRGLAWYRRPKSMFLDIVFLVKPSPDAIVRTINPQQVARGCDDIPSNIIRRLRKTLDKVCENDYDPVSNTYLDNEGDLARVILEIAEWLGVTRHGGIPWIIMPWRLGETTRQTYEAGVMNDYSISVEESQKKGMCSICNCYYLNIFAASLNFLNTKVFISSKQEPDRAVARRITPKKEWETINVVTLRRAERTKHPSDVEHQPVDWSCHWLVGTKDGGFWRRQYHPSTQTHVHRWIFPFIKGDTTKPFKPPSRRGYLVSR